MTIDGQPVAVLQGASETQLVVLAPATNQVIGFAGGDRPLNMHDVKQTVIPSHNRVMLANLRTEFAERVAPRGLPARLAGNLPLNEPDFPACYTLGEEGYNDYPVAAVTTGVPA